MVQKSPGRAFGVLAAVAAAGIVLRLSLRTGGAEKPQAKRCVVVWSEGTAPKNVYPNDINGAIAEGLKDLKGWEVIKVYPGPLLTLLLHGRSIEDTSAADLLPRPRGPYGRHRSLPIAPSEGRARTVFHSLTERSIMAVLVASLTNDITTRKDRKHDSATTSFHPD